MLCFPVFFSAEKLKLHLELSTLRLRVASNKLSSKISETQSALRKEAREARRKLQCETIIRDEERLEAYEIIQMMCEGLTERIHLIKASKKCPIELEPVVATVIFALEACVEEQGVKEQFRAKYGRKFVQEALENRKGIVDERIVFKLLHGIPSDVEIQDCWDRVQNAHQRRQNRLTETRLERQKQRMAEAKLISQLSESTDRTDDTTEHASVPPLNPDYLQEEDEVPVCAPQTSTLADNQSPLSPILPYRVFRPNDHLEIVFDVRTKNPVYVMERILASTLNASNNIPRPAFYEEPSLPIEYRSRLAHYKNSGYDRGHLAPAANCSADTIADSFTLCNVSPQVGSMNVSIWKKLEIWCRNIAKDQKETHIVSGPLWLPQSTTAQGDAYEFHYAAISTGNTGDSSVVAVPTHFFKAVAIRRSTGLERVACFLVPNAKADKTKNLQDFKVTWKTLETVSGLQFFPTRDKQSHLLERD